MKITGIDPGVTEGDYTAEVDLRVNADGTMTVLDVRRFRTTIDLTAVEIK